MLFSTLLAQFKDLGPIDCTSGGGAFCPTNPADSATMLETITTAVISMLTLVAGLAFLVYFMIGALNWVTAGGDKGKVDTAKMYMTNGAIGMITIVAAYAVIWIVGQVLGLEILNPADSSLFGGNGSNSSAASQSQNLPINNQLGGPQE